MLEVTERGGALLLTVKVVPRASRSEIVGEQAGALRVRLAAPPVDGAANAELIKTLAKALGVSPRNVEIMSGHTAKIKRVSVTGATAEALQILA